MLPALGNPDTVTGAAPDCPPNTVTPPFTLRRSRPKRMSDLPPSQHRPIRTQRCPRTRTWSQRHPWKICPNGSSSLRITTPLPSLVPKSSTSNRDQLYPPPFLSPSPNQASPNLHRERLEPLTLPPSFQGGFLSDCQHFSDSQTGGVLPQSFAPLDIDGTSTDATCDL
ncbi:hypothetical protein FKM82_024252 [Ascaphus truei]